MAALNLSAVQPSQLTPRYYVAARVHVPLIDFSELHGSSAMRSIAVNDIGKACLHQGFFQVINHGISPEVMQGAILAAKSFFYLPKTDPTIVDLTSNDFANPVRYGASMEGDKIRRFFLKHYANPLEQWIHLWPSTPPEYQFMMGKYAAEVRRVAMEITEAVIESLGLGRGYLKDKMEDGLQLMTVNSYPACGEAKGAIGMPAHSDFSVITVLLQSLEGLEELDPETNAWTSPPAIPGSLLVHGGDFLEVISNGRYKSAVHRVASDTEKTRYSIASLHGLDMDETVGVAEELVDEYHPKEYKDGSFRDFLGFLCSRNPSLGEGMNYLDTLKIM